MSEQSVASAISKSYARNPQRFFVHFDEIRGRKVRIESRLRYGAVQCGYKDRIKDENIFEGMITYVVSVVKTGEVIGKIRFRRNRKPSVKMITTYLQYAPWHGICCEK